LNAAARAATVTSARFANVAFSQGSRLAGVLQRLAKRQPLAVPRGVARYFVSPIEAGQLCLLAATVAPAGHLVIPRLDAQRDLVLLEDVAVRIVQAHGHAPCLHDDEARAKLGCAEEIAAGRYPILRTPLDTAGEKACEEFVAAGESVVDVGFAELAAIRAPAASPSALGAFLAELEREVNGLEATLGKDRLARRLASLVPGFQHAVSDKHLDQRM
jgi:FlaA1/EpsC-like NDP-sugar epimerase